MGHVKIIVITTLVLPVNDYLGMQSIKLHFNHGPVMHTVDVYSPDLVVLVISSPGLDLKSVKNIVF